MTRKHSLFAVLAISALALVACGSDDDTTSTTAASQETTAETTGGEDTTVPTDDGLAAAQAVVDQYSDTNQPIGLTIPLTEQTEPHTIAWLECELESCKYITQGFQQATEAIGWELVIISSESANPAPYFQAAIDQGVDFIASSGEAPSLYEEQAMAAKEKGIKILSCFDTTLPDGPNSNIWTQCGDTTFVEKTGPLMADWAVVDSQGTANILVVSIPDFPVLKAETDAFQAELAKNCAACKATELNMTIDDLIGGTVPAKVAAAVQADSSINYVFFSFGSLPSGVTAALSDAGLLDQVTVFGQDASTFGLQEIIDGTMAAWSADPKAYAAFVMVDAAARLSLGMELTEERAAASLPTYLIQTPEDAQAVLDNEWGDWNPPSMIEDFKKLWLVA